MMMVTMVLIIIIIITRSIIRQPLTTLSSSPSPTYFQLWSRWKWFLVSTGYLHDFTNSEEYVLSRNICMNILIFAWNQNIFVWKYKTRKYLHENLKMFVWKSKRYLVVWSCALLHESGKWGILSGGAGGWAMSYGSLMMMMMMMTMMMVMMMMMRRRRRRRMV